MASICRAGAGPKGFGRQTGDGRHSNVDPLPHPPHLQAAYADLSISRGRLPIAERLAEEVLSLPIGPHMSDSEVEQVIAAVREAF